jgi:hypothetical protein
MKAEALPANRIGRNVVKNMKTSRLASLILVVPALLSGPVHGEDAVGKLELTLPSLKPEVFERVDMPVSETPSSSSPFDPEAVALDLEVTPPGGAVLHVPGFFAREFDRKLEGRREVLEPRREGRRVRFMVLEPGRILAGGIVAVALGGAAVDELVPAALDEDPDRTGIARVIEVPKHDQNQRLLTSSPTIICGGLCHWQWQASGIDADS